MPEYLTPLGRTAGFGANGSVSNLAPFPAGGVVAPRRLVRSGEFDVIHVHEPIVPLVGWNATLGARDPVVGTFHSYATKPLPNHIAIALGARRVFNRLSARIAVSEAAAWTGRRWFGGEYRIIPNGRTSRSRTTMTSGSSSSAARRSVRGCRSCSPPSARWSSTSPAG
jgi:phosphatidylinositol alpha-mannosyltransferase